MLSMQIRDSSMPDVIDLPVIRGEPTSVASLRPQVELLPFEHFPVRSFVQTAAFKHARQSAAGSWKLSMDLREPVPGRPPVLNISSGATCPSSTPACPDRNVVNTTTCMLQADSLPNAGNGSSPSNPRLNSRELSPSAETLYSGDDVIAAPPRNPRHHTPSNARHTSAIAGAPLKMHTLDDFIRMTTTLHPDAPGEQSLHDAGWQRHVSCVRVVAHSAALDDVFRFLVYAAGDSRDVLVACQDLAPSDELASKAFSFESASKVFRRLGFKLKQATCLPVTDAASLLDLRARVQHALTLAICRKLFDIASQDSIVCAALHLQCELNRPPTVDILDLRRFDSSFLILLSELQYRLNIAVQCVRSGMSSDHGKVDALLELVGPRTLILVRRQSHVPILLACLSTAGE